MTVAEQQIASSTQDWSQLRKDPYPLLIDGELVAPAGRESLDVVYPFTNETVARVYTAGPAEVDRAVASARAAADAEWGRTTASERQVLLLKLAELIEQHADLLSFLETVDVGGPYGMTRYWVIPNVKDYLLYYSGLARTVLGEVYPTSVHDTLAYRVYEPVGVVAEMLPWNGPLLMGLLKVGAILAAGNSVVIKPPSAASLTFAALGELFLEAGFPRGVVNIVCGTGDTVGDQLVAHPDVDMVSLTGGTATGKHVMARAAGTLKKVSLELGGKSPNIVFADANLEEAIPESSQAIFMFQGEICVCGSRLLLQRSLSEGDFVDRLVAQADAFVLGDPFDPATTMGPLISRRHQQRVLEYIRRGQAEGARLIRGGSASAAFPNSNFVEPTIFTDVASSCSIAQEEIFGPVLCILPFSDEAEAIRIANDSLYGLASAVWTRDLDRALRMTRAIRAGQVYVNSYYSPSMHETPMAGQKQSGVGEAGLTRYLQSKAVFIKVNN